MKIINKILLFTFTYLFNISMNNKYIVNASYWCAWGGNQFTNGSNFTKGIPISDIPDCYNVLIYAFAVSDMNLSSSNAKIIEAEYFQTSIEKPEIAIRKFIEKGKKFLISVGGAEGAFLINNNEDANRFSESMINIINKYGFNGLDIDLENYSTSSNPFYFAQAIKIIVDYYRNQGIDFWLTFAMEWPYLRLNSFYTNLIKELGNGNIQEGIKYTTYFWPQLYNQGPLNGFQINPWPAKWNEINPKESGMSNFVINFIKAITDPIISSYNNWICIPIDKLVITLPASNGAVNEKMLYVLNENCIKYVLSHINNLIGFNNWSIDFDAFDQKGDHDYSFNCYDSSINNDNTHKPWSFGKACFHELTKNL